MDRIEVKCPNAACSAVFAVAAAKLGGKACCYGCGTEFVVTASARPGPAQKATMVDSRDQEVPAVRSGPRRGRLAPERPVAAEPPPWSRPAPGRAPYAA